MWHFAFTTSGIARIATACMLVLTSPCITANEMVQTAIKKNTESLAGIKSYYLHLVQDSFMSTDGPLVRECEWKIWHSDLRARRLSRGFYSVGSNGPERFPEPNGDVNDISWSDKAVRNLRGWDSAHPFHIPLDFSRNSREFSRVQCGVAFRNPTEKVNAVEAAAMLWEITPGWTLGDASNIANFVEEKTDGPGIVRLRLESTSDPVLTNAVGLLVDLDPEHGWLVRRIERRTPHAVGEVIKFAKSTTGVWCPHEIHGTVNGKLADRIVVEEFTINKPIPPDQLQVQFPQGAKVRDSSNGSFHVWGIDKPEKTFTNTEALTQYLYTKAKESQSRGSHPDRQRTGVSGAGRWFVITANLAILVLLAGVIVIRRRLSRGR